MLNRRTFCKYSLITGAGLILLSGIPFSMNAANGKVRITILHTNDVHSRIEPFPNDGGINAGKGGFAARSHLINKIRKEEQNVLLFDAGDMLQGTPYFNFFNGETEFRLMSEMGYDAACIGNHEFDAGIQNLARLAKIASFPLIVSNYDFTNTPMDMSFQPYKVFEIEDCRIGVYGLGVNLDGLVQKQHYGNTQYINPLITANQMETILKSDHKCDLIICLSHLGFKYDNDQISDVVIAKNTEHTHLIIGGHTHTHLKEGVKILNKSLNPCHIVQTGWGGIRLGRIDLWMDKLSKQVSIIKSNSLTVC